MEFHVNVDSYIRAFIKRAAHHTGFQLVCDFVESYFFLQNRHKTTASL